MKRRNALIPHMGINILRNMQKMRILARREKCFRKSQRSAVSILWAVRIRIVRSVSFILSSGSFPERDRDQLFNTSLSFGPKGELLGKYRKIHLFDVNVPGKITFKESETLSPGKDLTIIETGE